MSPSQASGPSLIHLRRPTQLTRRNTKPRLEVVVHESPNSDMRESPPSSPSNSARHTITKFCPFRVVPSMKVDTEGPPCQMLNASRQQPSHCSSDHTTTQTTASASFPVNTSADILRCVHPRVLSAKPRQEWQRDEDSALCNHPFCSTMFGQSSFPFGPRRHHCRLCGLIFCQYHSSGTLPIRTTDARNRTTVLSLRVCDGCHALCEGDLAERRHSETAPSLVSSDSSANDDILASPGSSAVDLMSVQRSGSSASVTELEPRLAPIEEWMDRSGILSLYPLAVQPSHARRSPSASRSAGPLFAPSVSDLRNLREKEMERQSLRLRRNFVHRLPTPCGSDAGSECDDDSTHLRSLAKDKEPSGMRTPQERELDWSTF